MPEIHVDLTVKSSFSMTKSASAPKFSVPFVCSMPKHLAGCKVAASMANTVEQPAQKHKLKILIPSNSKMTFSTDKYIYKAIQLISRESKFVYNQSKI